MDSAHSEYIFTVVVQWKSAFLRLNARRTNVANYKVKVSSRIPYKIKPNEKLKLSTLPENVDRKQ